MHQFTAHHFKRHVEFLDHISGGKSTMVKRPPQVQVPGNSKFQAKKMQNLILTCLEMLLPSAERLISPEDRSLVEMCTSKLGMVCMHDITSVGTTIMQVYF